MKKYVLLGIGASALAALIPLETGAADSVQIPVMKGENLISALRRVHPCFDHWGVRVPEQVLTDNPERPGADGNLVLANPMLKVPTAFLDKGQCKATPSHAPASLRPEPSPSPSPAAEAPHPRMLRKGPQLVPEHAEQEGAGESAHEGGQDGPHESGEESHAHPRNRLAISGVCEFTRLAPTVFATGARPVFVSNPQPGFELVYSHRVSERFSLGISYGFLKTSLQEQEAFPSHELSTIASEIAVNLTYRISHHSRLTLSAGAAQVDQLTYNPDDAEILIDHNFRGTLGFTYWHELATFSGFELVGALGGTLYVPTRWSEASFGLGQSYKLVLEREFTPALGGELGVLGDYNRQETPAESHSDFSLAIALGITLAF